MLIPWTLIPVNSSFPPKRESNLWPVARLVRESVEVMCQSVQGKKGDQYCELGFPKGMT